MSSQQNREIEAAKSGESSLTLLLVDSCPDTFDALRKYTAGFGIQIEQTPYALEALRRMKESRYGIVLMEYEHPDITGAAALKEFRAWEKKQKVGGTHIFAVTDLWNIRRCNKMLRAGCSGFLRKPFEEEHVIQVLTRSGFGVATKELKPAREIRNAA